MVNTFVRFDAGFDRNGNARRLDVVIDGSGDWIDVYREDARGLAPLRDHYPGIREADFSPIRTSATEIRRMVKDFETRDIQSRLRDPVGPFELFYSTDGHGGPYGTFREAKEAARKLLKGSPSERWIDIVPADGRPAVRRIFKDGSQGIPVTFRKEGFPK